MWIRSRSRVMGRRSFGRSSGAGCRGSQSDGRAGCAPFLPGSSAKRPGSHGPVRQDFSSAPRLADASDVVDGKESGQRRGSDASSDRSRHPLAVVPREPLADWRDVLQTGSAPPTECCCPYGYGKVHASAKKCMHCGEWLEEHAEPAPSKSKGGGRTNSDGRGIALVLIPWVGVALCWLWVGQS